MTNANDLVVLIESRVRRKVMLGEEPDVTILARTIALDCDVPNFQIPQLRNLIAREVAFWTKPIVFRTNKADMCELLDIMFHVVEMTEGYHDNDKDKLAQLEALWKRVNMATYGSEY